MARGLLKLVHSRRASAHAFSYTVDVRIESDTGATVVHKKRVESEMRSFVLGATDRADFVVPGGALPRHLALITVPVQNGVHVRMLSLHPERGLQAVGDGFASGDLGSMSGLHGLDARFSHYQVSVRAFSESRATEPLATSSLPLGEQLAFHRGTQVHPVGDVVSSVSRTGGGSVAVPALVTSTSGYAVGRSLVLYARSGPIHITPDPEDLRRGMLVGRSRRCALGRGFDENDGLSRVHALVASVGDGVYLFDLASRYGIRDVTRPARLIRTARLDDGAGCLVYGAGHLVCEET